MSNKFKIPDMLRNMRQDKHDSDWDKYSAIHEAAITTPKHLRKAENGISAARDFCETLRGHLIEQEAYSEVTVVERIEKLICRARDRLDKHGRAYSNLFIAYFDGKGGASDEKIEDRNEGFLKARRQFDDARSFIQLAERVDDWDDNAIPALVRSASEKMDEASEYFYETATTEGGAS